MTRHSHSFDAAAVLLPAAAPRRGLSCVEAAAYIGIGQSKFLELVEAGRMPKPIRIDRRVIWDVRALDTAFDALSEAHAESLSDPIDGGWGDEAP